MMSWTTAKIRALFLGVSLSAFILIVYRSLTNPFALQMNGIRSGGKYDNVEARLSSGKTQELILGVGRALSTRDIDFVGTQVERLLGHVCGSLEVARERMGKAGWFEEECRRMREQTSTEAEESTTYRPFQGEKLIHIDLKGAPPLVSYIKQFFRYIRKLGATGVLIEYEDMFFYKNELQNIRAKNAYRPKALKSILKLAEENDLMVIPMIQVLGHIEFVLKLKEFKELREIKDDPETLCPTNEKAISLIKKMIDQVLEIHPKSRYIHLGCNEVRHLGKCDRCRDLMRQKNWSTAELFLSHLKNVGLYINDTYPGVRPIVWGDMFDEFDKPLIVTSEIYRLMDVMVLVKGPVVTDYLTDRLVYLYASVFKIWIASEFKDDDGPNQGPRQVNFHLENQISWMGVVHKWKKLIKFKGIALIGRQRRNHFSELCELLPVSIPSITVSLIYLNDTNSIEGNTTEKLQCGNPIVLRSSSYYSSECVFPGLRVYKVIDEFDALSEKIRTTLNITHNGQFNVYNMMYKFVNPAKMKVIFEVQSVEENLSELLRIEQQLKVSLSEIYDRYTVEEWITTYIMPIRVKLEALIQVKEALVLEDTWPRRPFALENRNIKQIAQKICDFDKQLDCALLLI